MRLQIRHETGYSYDPKAERVTLRLKLFPAGHAGQTVTDWKVTVNGEEVKPLLSDAYGDEVALWQRLSPLGEVVIVAEGEVETSDTAGVLRGTGRQLPSGIFLRETRLTDRGEAVREFVESLPDGAPLERLHALSEAVAEAITYRPKVTDSHTTASEALRIGAGVCQDHAHVFVAAARMMGFPARYVAGYVLPGGDVTDEGVETHAWAEALVADLGWVGFDPANQVCPTEQYVRLSIGLDAAEAAPVNGNVLGSPEIGHSVEVRVTAAQTAAQQQSQSQ